MSQRFSNITAVPQTNRVPPQAPEAEQAVLGGLLV